MSYPLFQKFSLLKTVPITQTYTTGAPFKSPMKIKETLRSLKNYFAATRQAGHTTAMVRGAQNVDSVIILASTQHHADQLQKQIPSATVKTITNPSALIGTNKPLVIDNAALWEILGGSLAEIERLERHIKEISKADSSNSSSE